MEAELRNLLNLVTVTETCFFRDASQFRLLREHIIPTLVAASRRRPSAETIRIWSAGCSSGEEAYSIAITLEDMGLYLRASRLDVRDRRDGSEFDGARESAPRRVFARARCATSRPACSIGIFTQRRQEFPAERSIRHRVKFEFGNLTQTPMPSTGLAGRHLLQERRDLFSVRRHGETRSGPARHAGARRLSAARATPSRYGRCRMGSSWSSMSGRSVTGRRRGFQRPGRSRVPVPAASPRRPGSREPRNPEPRNCGTLKPPVTPRALRLLPGRLSRGRLGVGGGRAYRRLSARVRRLFRRICCSAVYMRTARDTTRPLRRPNRCCSSPISNPGRICSSE